MTTGSEQPEQTAEEVAAAKARYEALLESADPFVVAFKLMKFSWGSISLCLSVAIFFFLLPITLATPPHTVLYYWWAAEGGLAFIPLVIVCLVHDWDIKIKQNDMFYSYRVPDWNKVARNIVLGLIAIVAIAYIFTNYSNYLNSASGISLVLFAMSCLSIWIASLRAPRAIAYVNQQEFNNPVQHPKVGIGFPVWRVGALQVPAAFLLSIAPWALALRMFEPWAFSATEVGVRICAALGSLLLIYSAYVSAVLAARAHFLAVFGDADEPKNASA